MKSVSEEGVTPAFTRSRRVKPYVLPLIAIPTAFGTASVTVTPAPSAITSYAPVATSVVGLELDRAIARQRRRIALAEMAFEFLGDIVFARLPKSVRRQRMRVVRRQRMLAMPESEADLAAMTAVCE